MQGQVKNKSGRKKATDPKVFCYAFIPKSVCERHGIAVHSLNNKWQPIDKDKANDVINTRLK